MYFAIAESVRWRAVVLVWERAARKKALNAILFAAAAWALNTGTHSFKKGGSDWQDEFIFVKEQ